MYLIKAWIYPAVSGITRESVCTAMANRPAWSGAIAHVHLSTRTDWWLIGIYVDGACPMREKDAEEWAGKALAALLSDHDSIVRVSVTTPSISTGSEHEAPGLPRGVTWRDVERDLDLG